MNKTIRNIGIGLFLAGATFQIEAIITKEDISSTGAITQESYAQAQQELTDVKQQLAKLQLDLNSARQDRTNESEQVITETPADHIPSEASMTLDIQKGMTSSEISAKLEDAGIIQNKMDLNNYLTDQGLAGRIQLGNYEVNSSMSLKQIAETFTR